MPVYTYFLYVFFSMWLLSLYKYLQLLQMATTEHYESSAVVISEGEVGEQFYIITSGVVRIEHGGLTKKYTAGDFFGERSLLTGEVTIYI